MTLVRGLSWDHTRGHAPMVATSSAWHDRHPDVTVHWSPRSLSDFAGGALAEYVGRYDLVALDHPLVGEAVENGWIEPLESFLPQVRIDALSEASIGPSFASYRLDGATWAAPLDAATLASAYRADLLDVSALPNDYDELLDLAATTHRVAMPLTIFGCVAVYLSFCAELGAPLADRNDSVDLVDSSVVGVEALTRLARLVSHLPEYCFSDGAVQLLGRLASTEELSYVGYAYGYSTYARPGFFPYRVTFTPCPPLNPGGVSRPTIGGVGLALLTAAPERDAAVDYLSWVTSADSQDGLFTTSGGQPARRTAWQRPELDALNGGFFSALAQSMDQAFLRPNAAWFGRLQPILGMTIRDALQARVSPETTQAALDRLFHQHRSGESARP